MTAEKKESFRFVLPPLGRAVENLGRSGFTISDSSFFPRASSRGQSAIIVCPIVDNGEEEVLCPRV